MKKIKLYILWIAIIIFCSGCAGISRGCSSCNATQFGSDWIIVQYDVYGNPFNAWKLQGESVTNESSSDGIYWKDTKTGHLVHISGWYNRVQVENGRFEEACELTGVKLEYVKNGRYIDSGNVNNKKDYKIDNGK